MHILLLRTLSGIKYARAIQNYFLSRGIHCCISDIRSVDAVINAEGLVPNNTLIHARTAGPMMFRKARELEQRGFRMINGSQTLFRTSNKYAAQRNALKHGLPAAQSYKVKTVDRLFSLLKKHTQLVLKPIYSQSRGLHCHKVRAGIRRSELERIFKKIPGDEIVVQEFVPYNRLIRVIVIGMKALKAATTFDTPRKNSWKASVCLNPYIKKMKRPPLKLMKLAEKTAKIFDANINYIDFFEDANGDYIFNEINTACNLLIHERITGIAIHAKIGDFLIHEAKKRLQAVR